MIRYKYIYDQVLRIYRQFDVIRFPLELDNVISSIPSCRALTYREFAQINECSIDDVIALCESKSGCTHYDVANDRYLILWNDDSCGNNVAGRRRWTKAHEVGHVSLNHLPTVARETHQRPAENSFNNLNMSELETEADRFAATLLCPMPLYEVLGVSSPADIKDIFGLSAEASSHRWSAYIKCRDYRRKTAWEREIVQIYLEKNGGAINSHASSCPSHSVYTPRPSS